VAWVATADGKTRLTAGTGVFYDTLPLIVYRRALRGAPDSPQRSYTIPFGVAGFPSFPNSLTVPPTSVEAARRDLVYLADDISNPYSIQASLGMERDLGGRFAVSVNGLYSRTLKQWRDFDINHPEPFIRTVPGQRRTGAVADRSRPFTTYDGVPVRNISVVENSNSSRYWGIDLGVRRKYASGVRMEAHYLLSSAMTHSTIDSGQPNEWNDLGAAEWGPSDFHQRHRFVGSATIDLPYGVRFATIGTIASGLPVNPLTGVDSNGDTYPKDRPVGFGRNSFRAPRQRNLDVGLSKQWRLGEGRRVETRLDIFNVLNQNNFTHVNDVYGDGAEPLDTFLDPIAGIQDADPSRRIQFGLRFLLGQR
jgi:hypothetical protein